MCASMVHAGSKPVYSIIAADKLGVFFLLYLLCYMYMPIGFFFLQLTFVAELNQLFEDADERRKVSCDHWFNKCFYQTWYVFNKYM